MEQDTTKRGVGVVVVLAFLLAVASFTHNFWFDRTLTTEHESALTSTQQIGAIEVALADLRAAQTGYLAVGQSPDFWMRRATELSQQIETAIAAAQSTSISSEARGHEDAAAAALASLMALDKRARDQIQNDQRLVATDLLLGDSLEPSQRLAGELAAARTAESAGASARLVRTARMRMAANAAVAVLLVGLVGLASRPSRVPVPVSSSAQTAQMLRELPPPVKPAVAVAKPVAPPAPALVSNMNLPDAAELCVDLARVMDGRDIPTLLERAATVLGAKGVILWMADPGGVTLRPSLTHGYSDRVITRLDTLDVSAENVTSLSFRSMRPQIMNGTGLGAAGAVAVPLVTSAGCTGVLAAEIRESRPAPETIAVARILAAQFATLIGPGQTAAASRAAEA